MKTRTIVICVIAFLFQHNIIKAQSVSKELATQTAIYYSSYSGCQTAPRLSQSIKGNLTGGVDTSLTRTLSFAGKAQLYLYEPEDGWVLLSSEMATSPILASSQTGKFPEYEDMPDGMKWLMSYYEDVLQYARDSLLEKKVNDKWNTSESEYRNSGHAKSGSSHVLTRMAQVHWDQNDNNDGYATNCNKTYNKFCPIGVYPYNHCGHTFVGCDAVAIGQVMWFHQWPHSAMIPDAPNSIYGPKHDVYYDWSLMPTEIHNNTDTAYVNLVASFLRDCGYANNTQYGDSGSSSNLINDSYALRTFFYYNSEIQHLSRAGTTDWISKLKAEIDAERPVIYRGGGNKGGHAFILFGYDENDKFYVNWGWGGGPENNSSYSLDVLEPTNGNGTFNDNQAALFYVEPDYCATQKINPSEFWTFHFNKSYIGNIEIGNRTIVHIARGSITASNSIHLSHGFRILPGAKVSITIDGTPCESIGNNRQNSPERIQQKHHAEKDNKIYDNIDKLYISPNPVASILHIQTSEELSQAKVYTINGQCVMQAAQTDIDVSALPQGMYILRALTADGQQHQAKFIKQ